MSRTTLLSSPLMLGFDEIERVLDRVTKGASDGYPPYNIERVPAEDDSPETLRITLAVAGFTRDRVDAARRFCRCQAIRELTLKELADRRYFGRRCR